MTKDISILQEELKTETARASVALERINLSRSLLRLLSSRSRRSVDWQNAQSISGQAFEDITSALVRVSELVRVLAMEGGPAIDLSPPGD